MRRRLRVRIIRETLGTNDANVLWKRIGRHPRWYCRQEGWWIDAQRWTTPRGLPDGARRDEELRRAGRELPRRARCAARHEGAARLRPVSAGGRRGLHGGRLWQADRFAGHRLRHPRARRDQRVDRRPHGDAGFGTDAALRWPGRHRHEGPRGVSGARLQGRLRHHGKVGRRDRPGRAHPRNHRARMDHGHHRPSRPGGDRAARGHADQPHRNGTACRPAPKSSNRNRQPLP